jgi:GTP-binding protein
MPVAAIIGRPNVGKSTLFNRLIGERRAVTSERAGTTRDRLYAKVNWNGRDFLLADTGGLVAHPESQIEAGIRVQALEAVREADVVLFVVEGGDAPLAEDYDVASLLRPIQDRVLLVANKVDRAELEAGAHESSRLGLGAPIAISAIAGRGIGDLLDAVADRLPRSEPIADEDAIRIAVVGRPNVGKSSLVNALVGREEVLVADEPGTTRDAIDTRITQGCDTFVLIDTAGLRRRSRVDDSIEYHSTLRTLKVLESCDVALILFDATHPPEKQDLHIAGMAEQFGKGIILLVNKWDLTARDESGARTLFRDRLPFLDWAPLRFVSAKTGESVREILPLAAKVHSECARRISTSSLIGTLKRLWAKHPPPGISNSGLFGSQGKTNPPTFVIFVRRPEEMPRHYMRYLENGLREVYGFRGAPLRIHLKKKRERKREVSRDSWAS